MSFTRSSGLLLHISSLPSRFGIGDLGEAAYRFADFLEASGQRLWQVLPLVPVGHGHSPYASPSTFAGNPLFIAPDLLAGDGLLTDGELAEAPDFPGDRVDFERVLPYKRELLAAAFARFEAGEAPGLREPFRAFAERQAFWLDDYALFVALKDAHGGGAWTEWPAPLVHREPEALAAAAREHERAVRMQRFWQFLFYRQWAQLRAYCHARGIQILGDLPIYVAHDSADVWSDQALFHLEADGRPTVVAGVPPDYFSETGQRWGNPLYRWDRMKANDYRWWTHRLRSTFDLVDILRLDHFRGFEAYWSIPAEEPTAVNGEWVPGPGADLFHHVHAQLGELPIVAEDLGLITPEVTALMDELGFPGMAVLQFAFGEGPDGAYLPHHYRPGLAAYTGTHDNNTTVGWWEDGAQPHERDFARTYLDLADGEAFHWTLVRALLGSVADLAVTPVQDVLGLGSEARMNTPGEGEGNWGWRLAPDALTDEHAERLRHFTWLYGRLGEKAAD